LIEAAGLQPSNVRIVIIGDPQINAFTAGGQIVYVEDNPINALLMQEVIEQRPDCTLHLAVSVRDGIVRLKLHGTCGSCPSSSLTLKNAVEEALYDAAPDILEIVAENAAAEPSPASNLVVLK